MSVDRNPDPKAHDVKRHEFLFIGGDWVAPSSADRIEVFDPATEQAIGVVPAGTTQDVDRAVRAAAAALPAWQALPPGDRAQWCRRIGEGLAARADELSALITAEVGCPLPFSAEVQTKLPIDKFLAMPQLAETIPFVEFIDDTEVVLEGIGVVGAITPWNYPLLQITEKVGGALVAGCTVVLKPSEMTPLNAFVLAEVAESVGLPAGVLNIVTGTGPATGTPLVEHPLVDMVSFTGSTAVGREVSRLAALRVKPTALELGGKSASVVLSDVDDDLLATAVRRTVGSSVSNSGQTCSALTRLVVPEALLARVEELAVEAARAIVVGDPRADGVAMGPLVSGLQRERVLAHVRSGLDDGARLLVGGVEPPVEGAGHFVAPTVFTDVRPEMAIAREEIFGPVLVILTYPGDEDTAVELANATDYGLAGAVWSADPAAARRVAGRIRTGVQMINGAWGSDDAPFGGFKQSGHGRESGAHGVREFLTAKVYAHQSDGSHKQS